MLDEKHPLMRLLAHTDLLVMLAESNFQLFTKLEAALNADVKSLDDTGQVDAVFQKPLIDTNDLFQTQAAVLHAMIEGWSLAVMEELTINLNELSGSDAGISLYVDGDLQSARLFFDNIEAFVSGVDINDVAEIRDELDSWKNSCELIDNYNELIEGLDAIS